MHKSRTSLAGKLFSLLMAMAMVLSLIPTAAFAADADEKKTEGKGGTYVLMNIPYNEFYAAEGVNTKVDAVSSSTKSKTRAGNLAANSYHVKSDGSDITGVIYPVYVEDMSVLSSYRQVADEDQLSITVTLRGKENTTDYKGSGTLFENPSYSYYVLDEAPTGGYKELTVNADNSFSFSAVKNATDISSQATDVEVTMTTGGRHTDYEITLKNLPYSTDDQLASMVSAVTLATEDGNVYGLRHVYEIWRGTELGFNANDAVYGKLQGETVTEITYYLNNGEVFTVNTELEIPELPSLSVEDMLIGSTTTKVTEVLTKDLTGSDVTKTYTVNKNETNEVVAGASVEDGVLTMPGNTAPGTYTLTMSATKDGKDVTVVPATFVVSEYVLMNIPYNAFYQAEISDSNEKAVDAVSSSTKTKTKNTGLVGGSYHVNSDGSDITGITYPVKISDASLLTGLTKAESNDALFENVSYAYTILSTDPSYYKEATATSDGTLTFGAVQGAKTPQEATTTITDQSNYGDYQISVKGLPDDIGNVSAVVLKTKEGANYGLRHLENIWRKSELAFSTGFVTTAHGNTLSADHYKSIMGKTITEIEYITDSAIYTISTELYVPVRGSAVAIKDGTSGDGSVEVTFTDANGNTIDLPEGYEPTFKVDGLETTYVPATDDVSAKLKYTNAAPGSYSVTVTDASGKYARMKTSFTLSTTAEYAKYNEDNNAPALVAAQDADNFSAYLKNLSSVTVGGKSYSASGRGAVALFRSNGYLDITASPFSDLTAGKSYEITVSSTGYPDVTFTYTVPETIYAYASLTYAEYWAAEGVVAAGSTESSSEVDGHGETDRGAFDAVSRATTNHGLHRGSFQQVAVIHATTDTGESKDFAVASWNSGEENNLVLTDGSTVTFSKGTITYTVKSGRTSTEHTATMTGYEITGIKYVPVAIPASEFVSFAKAYTVTVNGDELSGGYTENNLQAYSKTALVTASTNGLKAVAKSGDVYTFGVRQTGSDSGILGTTQSKVTNVNATVKDNAGNFGEFVRVDLTGDGYGALGSKMQTVLWTYYGDDSTYATPVATYGTKFAADDWMHKAMGIQLGLTKSIRAALPEGTDGTGYWSITVYALGYEDYTVNVEVTADDISNETYVLMNIPYDKFYAAEAGKGQTAVDIDAVTSATLNKTRSTLAYGSYHNDGETLGDNISGVIYPVKISDTSVLSGKTEVTDESVVTYEGVNMRGTSTTYTYSGKEALFGSGDYAYYVLTETPKSYKTVSVDENGNMSFGAATGTETEISGASAEVSTTDHHVDVAISVTGLDSYVKSEENKNISTTAKDVTSTPKVYNVAAVTLTTTENEVYGLRHVYEIWQGVKLGFDLDGDYANLAGKTISKITYYLTDGQIVYFEQTGLTVPTKPGVISVGNAVNTAGKTSVTVTGLPSDYSAEYAVTQGRTDLTAYEFTVENGVLSWTGTPATGEYTLTVTDKNGKYVGVSATFTLTEKSSSGGGSSSSSSDDGYTVTTDSAKNGSVSVSPKSAAKGSTVTVTVKPDSGYELDKLTVTDKNGDTVKVTEKNGKYTFTMPASKVTVNASFVKTQEETPSSTGFADVADSAYYANAVKWAVEKGITSGTSNTTFSPSATCTRAQTVTFLWRAAGSPAPTGTENPFTDVKSGDYYYNAVLWAVEKGITSGTSDTTFSPAATVTRGQTVTFLYRAAGSPAVSGSSSFSDVSADAYYASPVQWAVSEGVTSGTGNNAFSPAADCTRGQIVTFLYQANQ